MTSQDLIWGPIAWNLIKFMVTLEMFSCRARWCSPLLWYSEVPLPTFQEKTLTPSLCPLPRPSLCLPHPCGRPGPLGSPHSWLPGPALVPFRKCSNPLRPGRPWRSRERIRSDLGEGHSCVRPWRGVWGVWRQSQDVAKAPPYPTDPGGDVDTDHQPPTPVIPRICREKSNLCRGSGDPAGRGPEDFLEVARESGSDKIQTHPLGWGREAGVPGRLQARVANGRYL